MRAREHVASSDWLLGKLFADERAVGAKVQMTQDKIRLWGWGSRGLVNESVLFVLAPRFDFYFIYSRRRDFQKPRIRLYFVFSHLRNERIPVERRILAYYYYFMSILYSTYLYVLWMLLYYGRQWVCDYYFANRLPEVWCVLGSTVWRRGGRRAFALPATTPSPRRVNNSQCSSAAYNQTMKLFL